MLINKLGVETDDEIVDLGSRRPTPDPKNRETLTTLLQVALSAVPRSELLEAPRAPITNLGTANADAVPGEATLTPNGESHTDVA